MAELGDSFAREVSDWNEKRVSEIAAPASSDSMQSVTSLSKTDSTMH